MDGKKLLGFFLLVLVVGVGAWMKFRRGEDLSARTRADIESIVKTMDDYAKHEKYLTHATEVAHQRAFDAAFELGSRRRASQFDADKYTQTFFDVLIHNAGQAGRYELAKSLEELKARMRTGAPE